MKTLLPIVWLMTLGYSCQKETIVTVASVDIWTGTKIEVKAGEIIIIEATGEVYGRYNPPDHIWGPLGPDGQTDEIADSLWMLPGVPKIALFAKIGEEGKPFKIGSGTRISAQYDGELFLGLNDRIYLHPQDHHYIEGESRQIHVGCYEDNKGEFTARIRVNDP